MNSEIWLWGILGYLVVDVLILISKFENNEVDSILATFTVYLLWPVIAIVKGYRIFVKWVPLYYKSVLKQIKEI